MKRRFFEGKKSQGNSPKKPTSKYAQDKIWESIGKIRKWQRGKNIETGDMLTIPKDNLSLTLSK